MIQEIAGLPDGVIGVKLTGKVTGTDYETLLTPLMDRAIEQYDRIRLFAEVGPDFDGYSLEAAWDDTKLGLRHWRGFERIAVATDIAWVRNAVRAVGFMMPCPVRVFPLERKDDARRWLEDSLGSIHLESEGNVIVAKLMGKLEPSTYDLANDEIAQMMGRLDHVRLLLDLREFDGWSGLAALGDHLSLIREYRHRPERIAVVGDTAWQRLAEKVMSRFVNAKARFFEGDDYEGAKAWVAT